MLKIPTNREQDFLTHRGMMIDYRLSIIDEENSKGSRWKRNALKGQFNSAQWQRPG